MEFSGMFCDDPVDGTVAARMVALNVQVREGKPVDDGDSDENQHGDGEVVYAVRSDHAPKCPWHQANVARAAGWL
jgi:hypothetical protein